MSDLIRRLDSCKRLIRTIHETVEEHASISDNKEDSSSFEVVCHLQDLLNDHLFEEEQEEATTGDVASSVIERQHDDDTLEED